MASSPGDLPPPEQPELFGQSGQGATQLEISMAKKSKKPAKKGPGAAPKKKKGKAVADDSVNETGAQEGDAEMTASADDGGGGGGKGRGKGKGKSGGGGGGAGGGGGGMG